MKKLSSDQAGFGLLEILLIIIAATLIVFTGYYISQNKTSNTAAGTADKTTAKTPASAKTVTPKSSDKDLITAAVKAYGTNSQDAVVNPDTLEITGNLAKGTVGFMPDGDGAAFIAHKDSQGQWTVIFEGQQLPGKDLGTKYNLPSGWYSADYN